MAARFYAALYGQTTGQRREKQAPARCHRGSGSAARLLPQGQSARGSVGQGESFEGEVFHKVLIMYDFFPDCFSCSPPVPHAAFGMAIAGSRASSSNGGTDGQGSGTKRPCGKGS